MYPFGENKKSLLTKICSNIEKLAINEEYFEKTQCLLTNMEKYFYDITTDLPCSLTCDGLCTSSLFKMYGIMVDTESNSLAEQIIDYMELVREFNKDRLFIFVNLRSYISDSTMNKFINTVLGKKLRILLIENLDKPKLKNER